jgi:hypothetical protein
MKKTGIELIAEERQRQIDKEGFTQEHDKIYEGDQLEDYAKFLLTGNDFYFPSGWDRIWHQKRFKRTHRENVIKAAALLAAYLDQIENDSTIDTGPKQ